MKRLSLLLPLLLILTACQPPEVTARDSVAAAKGFIEDQQAQHLTECKADKTKTACVAINDAVAAQNLAIDALNVYCSDDAFANQNGPCHANKDFAPKLQAAMQNLQSTINHVKVLLGK